MVIKSKSAHNITGKINFERVPIEIQRNKRPREELEPPQITITGSSASNESTRTLVPEDSPSKTNNGDPNIIKLDRLNDKKDRYESHISFLTRCINEKVVPKGLSIQLEPTIGNHNQEFVKNWYEKLNNFSIDLMKDIVKFCETTKSEVSEQIQTKETELQSTTNPETYTKVKKAIQENKQVRQKTLLNQKNRKFNRLKFPSNQITERQGRTNYSNNNGNRRRSSSRSRSQNRKPIFKTNNQGNNQSATYASILQKGNTRQQNNINQSNGRASDERNKQIEKLQQQINQLRNERNNTDPVQKNVNGAPRVGARQTQSGDPQTAEMTTKDVMDLINTTMLTLTAFASRLDQRNNDLLQTPQGM